MSCKKAISQGQEIILATSSKIGNPRAIVVISLGLFNKKLLIGACQMKRSLKNIKENTRVSIVAKYKNEYYRINGRAKIYSSGKFFEIALKRSEPPLPHHAITINIIEVFDLDKIKRIL